MSMNVQDIEDVPAQPVENVADLFGFDGLTVPGWRIPLAPGTALICAPGQAAILTTGPDAQQRDYPGHRIQGAIHLCGRLG